MNFQKIGRGEGSSDSNDAPPLLATNSKQFGARQETTVRKVNEIGTTHLNQQLANLTQIVQTLATSVAGTVKPCGIC